MNHNQDCQPSSVISAFTNAPLDEWIQIEKFKITKCAALRRKLLGNMSCFYFHVYVSTELVSVIKTAMLMFNL